MLQSWDRRVRQDGTTEQEQKHWWAVSDYLYEVNKVLKFNSQAEGQGPLRQAIMFDYYNSNKSKSKKQLSTWNQDWSFSATS